MRLISSSLALLALWGMICVSATAQKPAQIVAKPASPEAAHERRTLTSEEIQALIARVAEADIANAVKEHSYTYTQNQVEEMLDGKGKVKSTETKEMEILVVAGEQVERLVTKDGKPLSAHDAAKEEEKIQKVIDKHKNESEHDRQKREEKAAKEREDGRKFVREIGDAYSFRHLGYETVNGMETYVIEAEPKPDFHGHEESAKFLNKFRMKAWIGTGEPQLVKLDAEAIDTLTWGLFLARIHKGTRFTLEQTKVNDEVWLPSLMSIKADVRLALLKDFRIAQVNHYSDYKKFRSESKMTVIGEIEAAPELPK